LNDVFLAGPLRDEVLRAIVLEGALPSEDAQVVTSDQAVEGVMVSGLSALQLQRLAFYADASGLEAAERLVRAAAHGGRNMLAFLAPDGDATVRDFDDWSRRWAETFRATAAAVMAQFGACSPEELRRRWGQLLTRGGATVRAGDLRPGTEALRRQAAPQDVVSQTRRWPYANYFAVEEHDLCFRRFDGTMSAALDRAIFISGDAAVVLPYDPVRDRVMVIEQFRAGPYARGDANPWLIETVAGRIDGGETPEEAARREAEEEAGLTLKALIAGPRYYPSPAAKAEYIYSFVGIADLPDSAAGLGGLASEAEDIRSHVISFDRLMALVDSGEIDNAPLQLIAFWLARERPRIRADI